MNKLFRTTLLTLTTGLTPVAQAVEVATIKPSIIERIHSGSTVQ